MYSHLHMHVCSAFAMNLFAMLCVLRSACCSQSSALLTRSAIRPDSQAHACSRIRTYTQSHSIARNRTQAHAITHNQAQLHIRS